MHFLKPEQMTKQQIIFRIFILIGPRTLHPLFQFSNKSSIPFLRRQNKPFQEENTEIFQPISMKTKFFTIVQSGDNKKYNNHSNDIYNNESKNKSLVYGHRETVQN